ncbi:MAG: alkaline phosphatase family protein [Desulfobacter sp.]
MNQNLSTQPLLTKTLLLIVDGCRTDCLAATPTPAIDRLKEQGAWTFKARTVIPSITLPVHFSIFTAMNPVTHGVLSNGANPNVSGSAVGMVAWFKSLGRTTAMYYNWEYLRELAPPGCLNRSFFLDTACDAGGDMAVAELAAADMVAGLPDFAFVYLGCLDEAGHAHGYGSAPYLSSLARADQAIGHLLTTLEQAGVKDQYTILFQSDHGGMGHDHMDPVPEVLDVPWILSGPGICPGKIDRPDPGAPVSVMDTAPTLARCMGLPSHPLWQGRAVREAFVAPA